ncbi:MAG: hypothetical protein R3B81_02920 [bacterium]
MRPWFPLLTGLALFAASSAAADVAPKKLLVYYSWPSVIHGAPGPTDPVDRFAEYDYVVLGGGLEVASHPEHAFTVSLVADPRLANTSVFGYVDLGVTNGGQNLTPAQIQSAIQAWAAMGVAGVLLDDFGYEYGTSRDRQNQALDWVHAEGLAAIANAWVPADAFDAAIHPLNPAGTASHANASDFYLYESFRIRLDQYETESEWRTKADALEGYRAQLGFRVLGVTTTAIDDTTSYDESQFFHTWYSALLSGYEAVGVGEYVYSATGASNGWSPVYPRPDVLPGDSFLGPIQQSGSDYFRDTTLGRVTVNPVTHAYSFTPHPTAVDASTPAARSRSFPEPFRDEVELRLATPAADIADLTLWDVRGRRVRTLRPTDAARRDFRWDGRDETGREAPAGVYFWSARHGSARSSGRVTKVD